MKILEKNGGGSFPEMMEWNRILSAYNMSLHDLDTFIDQELGTIGLGGCSPVPSARTGTAGLLCRLQGCFGIGMGNPSADVFRRIALAGPDVIWHLGDGRDKKNGVMWVHGSKVSFCLCQSVAGVFIGQNLYKYPRWEFTTARI